MTPEQARAVLADRRDAPLRASRLEGRLAAAESTLRSQGQLLDQLRADLATRTRERDHLHQELCDAQAEAGRLTRELTTAEVNQDALTRELTEAHEALASRPAVPVPTIGYAATAGWSVTSDADLDRVEDALHVAGRVGGTEDTRAHARALLTGLQAARRG